MSTEIKKAEEPKADKQKKTVDKEYLVLKKFTGEKVYYRGSKVILNPDSEQTKNLLTNKLIK